MSLDGRDNVRGWMYVRKGIKRREDSTSGREAEDTRGREVITEEVYISLRNIVTTTRLTKVMWQQKGWQEKQLEWREKKAI